MMFHEPRRLRTYAHHGLGNRLLAVASTLRLVAAGYFDIAEIGWLANKELGAEPQDLFDLDCPVILGGPPCTAVAVRDGTIPHVPLRSDLTVTAWGHFTVWGDRVSKERFNRELHEAMCRVRFHSKFWRDLPVTDCVGLHCRRTDYLTGTRTERQLRHTRWDREFADEVERHFPTDRLFLASDSPLTKDYFRLRFGPRLILAPIFAYPEWRLRTRVSVEGAVIDLWLLSRCREVLADNWSTFSWAASLFGGTGYTYWPRSEPVFKSPTTP